MHKGMSLLSFHQFFFRNSTVVTTRGHSGNTAKLGCHLQGGPNKRGHRLMTTILSNLNRFLKKIHPNIP